jgi:hypothetical protein
VNELYESRCYSCVNKNPNLANACTPCFPQLHVEDINIATEINARLPVSCLIFDSFKIMNDRLCGLVVRVSGYRYRGLGFDSWRY